MPVLTVFFQLQTLSTPIDRSLPKVSSPLSCFCTTTAAAVEVPVAAAEGEVMDDNDDDGDDDKNKVESYTETDPPAESFFVLGKQKCNAPKETGSASRTLLAESIVCLSISSMIQIIPRRCASSSFVTAIVNTKKTTLCLARGDDSRHLMQFVMMIGLPLASRYRDRW
mmetsp:Transcript_3029/g.6825  ORF Transcript_3029/g.6825 Transcript_3029/m.6825 type:complete len:168 (+) Transcript_3029:939-1442(+)